MLVNDSDYAEPQQLRSHEAEKMHNMLPDSTAGGGASWKQRLKSIGKLIGSGSRLARINCMPEAVPTLLCLSEQDQMIGAALLEMLRIERAQFAAAALSKYSRPEQQSMLAFMEYLAPSENVLLVNDTLVYSPWCSDH